MANNEAPKCGCSVYCGDLEESEDNPYAICKGLATDPKGSEPWEEEALRLKQEDDEIERRRLY